MSATMNVDHFSEYFDKAPVIYVEGRQHTVDVLYSSQPQSDYVYASLGENNWSLALGANWSRSGVCGFT